MVRVAVVVRWWWVVFGLAVRCGFGGADSILRVALRALLAGWLEFTSGTYGICDVVRIPMQYMAGATTHSLCTLCGGVCEFLGWHPAHGGPPETRIA